MAITEQQITDSQLTPHNLLKISGTIEGAPFELRGFYLSHDQTHINVKVDPSDDYSNPRNLLSPRHIYNKSNPSYSFEDFEHQHIRYGMPFPILLSNIGRLQLV